jgi:hypothetical protein
MKHTGKNRITTDQFYTNRDVSSKCIQLLLKTVVINESDIIIEPSAGEGSFSDYFHQNEYHLHAFDIEPKKEYIKTQNFFELDITCYSEKNVHCIGNPPFGKQSTYAKQFIKKLSLFCDTISLILPKSFRKESYQKSFPLNFHLVEEIELEKNSFTIGGKFYNVPCIFQIWRKSNTDRYVEAKQIANGFRFIPKPKLENIKVDEVGKPIQRKNIFTDEIPDFGILRAGGGNTCGRISRNYEDGIACYPEAWLFIKLDPQYNTDKFFKEYKKINWKDDSNVGPRSISKPIFIKGINKLLQTINQ